MADVSNDEANELADEILLRDEFLPAREPGIVERSVSWVFEQIGDFLGAIFGAIFGGAGGAAGTTLAIILLSLAVALLVFAIVKAIRGRVPKPDEDETPGARIVFDEVVEPEQLRAELARHRSSRAWREAVIAGFRLAVVEVIDAGIAREVAGATTGDFGTAIERRRPELSDRYRPAARAFERAFYSDLDIDESHLGDVDRLLDAMSTAGAR